MWLLYTKLLAAPLPVSKYTITIFIRFYFVFINSCYNFLLILDNVVESRGIGSTIWDWITYPFSWWSSNPIETPPESEQLVGIVSNHDIEIGKHNVTVWCNDQTCTTMRCDKYGCVNVTCNIYDTDLNGECRKYNTSSQEEQPTVPSEPEKPVAEETSSKIPVTTEESVIENDHSNDDRPLELEVLMSSTVTEKPNKH